MVCRMAQGRLMGKCGALLDRNIAMSLVNQSANRQDRPLSVILRGAACCNASSHAFLACSRGREGRSRQLSGS